MEADANIQSSAFGESERDVVMEAGAGVMRFQDGGRSEPPRNVGRLQTPEKARTSILTWSLQKERNPRDISILALYVILDF